MLNYSVNENVQYLQNVVTQAILCKHDVSLEIYWMKIVAISPYRSLRNRFSFYLVRLCFYI